MSAHPERLLIRGGRPLRGEVAVSGSKNAALYTLAAALLTADPVTIHNVPDIADIGELGQILTALGARFEYKDETVCIEAAHLTETTAPIDLVMTLRASFLVMGPLLAGSFGARSGTSYLTAIVSVRPVRAGASAPFGL